MANWNKMMMDVILAKDEKTLKKKKKKYVDSALATFQKDMGL